MQRKRVPMVERKMQPGDQAVVAFVVAVFVIFSAIMAYASSQETGGKRSSSEKK